MVTRTRLYTAEELAAMPGDEPWELWYGELRKVPGAGGTASGVANLIAWFITSFVRPRGLGWITSSDGTFILLRDPDVVVVPDIGYISWVNLGSRKPPSGFIPVPPDLAVEIKSPSDRTRDIEEKLALYRAAGVPLVWWVFPDERTVSVYRHGALVGTLGVGDILDGGDILPGFTLPIVEIFSDL